MGRRGLSTLDTARLSRHGLARSIVTYRSYRPSQMSLRVRWRELTHAQVSWVYRRLHLLLRRAWWTINIRQVRRLYGAEGLPLAPRRPKKRRIVTARPDAAALTAASLRWAMECVHDVLLTGERIRALTIDTRASAWRSCHSIFSAAPKSAPYSKR